MTLRLVHVEDNTILGQAVFSFEQFLSGLLTKLDFQQILSSDMMEMATLKVCACACACVYVCMCASVCVCVRVLSVVKAQKEWARVCGCIHSGGSESIHPRT